MIPPSVIFVTCSFMTEGEACHFVRISGLAAEPYRLSD
jgi:hypothetical protein